MSTFDAEMETVGTKFSKFENIFFWLASKPSMRLNIKNLCKLFFSKIVDEIDSKISTSG